MSAAGMGLQLRDIFKNMERVYCEKSNSSQSITSTKTVDDKLAYMARMLNN